MRQKKNKLKTNPGEKFHLTKRELEVARLIAREYSHKMIAGMLGIKFRTVATHIHNIHNKTGTHNSAGIGNYIHYLDTGKKIKSTY
jgi:DNA-binding NarL/FixJ family response regulator